MVLPQKPVVNAGIKYIWGLTFERVSNTLIYVYPGAARDESNTNDIILDVNNQNVNNLGVLPVVSTKVGLNGLDSGTIAANSIYAVYAIGSSSSIYTSSNDLAGGPSPNPLGPVTVEPEPIAYPVGVILSLNATAPILPAGYDMYRRIGWAATDSASGFVEFLQYGNSDQRWYYWQTGASVLAAGASTSYADVDLSVSVAPGAGIPGRPVPPGSFRVDLIASLAGAATVDFLAPGLTSTNGQTRFGTAGAAVSNVTVGALGSSSADNCLIQYKVSASTVGLVVAGFEDRL